MVRRGSLAAVVASLAWSAPAGGATLPLGFSETLVAGGLASPTAMALAPNGRVFIAQQGGALRVVKNGSLLATPFVSLTVDSNGERGLLGVAFDPQFPTNQFVYVYYTVPGSPPHNRVSRFTAAGDVAVPGSELPILDLESLSSATNHNGGAIHFAPAPDGKLYVAVGENANSANSQTLANRLGKMLRISSDGTIPTDNPFFLDPTVIGDNKAIWAFGLRNPFTFAFQQATGRLFINDVGESTWEEINDGIAGSNYGWPVHEGVANDFPPYRDPVFAYNHTTGSPTGCAIVGGAFYNPLTPQFPADYAGDYFFGDLCSGWIKRFDPGTSSLSDFASGISSPVDVAVSDDGSLYYLARGAGGVLYQVTAATTIARVWGFTATRRVRVVVLRWRPGGDPRVLGFEVYRGGKQLNHVLIRATALCCTIVDRRAGREAQSYRLEVVLVDGSRRSGGSVFIPRRT